MPVVCLEPPSPSSTLQAPGLAQTLILFLGATPPHPPQQAELLRLHSLHLARSAAGEARTEAASPASSPPQWAAKEQQGQQGQQAAAKQDKKPFFNPFLPYEQALWVAHLSDTHTLLLNKVRRGAVCPPLRLIQPTMCSFLQFNVVAHHVLVVPNRCLILAPSFSAQFTFVFAPAVQRGGAPCVGRHKGFRVPARPSQRTGPRRHLDGAPGERCSCVLVVCCLCVLEQGGVASAKVCVACGTLVTIARSLAATWMVLQVRGACVLVVYWLKQQNILI